MSINLKLDYSALGQLLRRQETKQLVRSIGQRKFKRLEIGARIGAKRAYTYNESSRKTAVARRILLYLYAGQSKKAYALANKALPEKFTTRSAIMSYCNNILSGK